MKPFRGKLQGLSRDVMGGEYIVSFTTPADCRELYDSLKGKDLEITVKPFSRKRSLDANSFCWALCADIGKAMVPPIPKEDVYRKAIREVGSYFPLPVKAEAVETFERIWGNKGTGWFIEVVDDSKLKGYKLVFAYCGSSTYTVEEMSTLINYLVDEAKQMEIPIPISKAEEKELLERWGRR